MKQINNIEEFENEFDALFGLMTLAQQTHFFKSWWFGAEKDEEINDIYTLIDSLPEEMLSDVETFIEYQFEAFWDFIKYDTKKTINHLDIETLNKIKKSIEDEEFHSIIYYITAFVYANERIGCSENWEWLSEVIEERINVIKFDNDID